MNIFGRLVGEVPASSGSYSSPSSLTTSLASSLDSWLWGRLLGRLWRRFLRTSVTLAFERLLTNFTSTGRGGGGRPSSRACCMGPTRCDTAISVMSRGGSSFIRPLQRLTNFSSDVPAVVSGSPNTRMDSLLPCCSMSSRWHWRAVTSFRRFEMIRSLASTSFFNEVTVWDSMATVSDSFFVSGSRCLVNTGSRTSCSRSATSVFSRASRKFSLNSSIFLVIDSVILRVCLSLIWQFMVAVGFTWLKLSPLQESSTVIVQQITGKGSH